MNDLAGFEGRTSSLKQVSVEIFGVFQNSAKAPVGVGRYKDLIEKLTKSGSFIAEQGSLRFVRFGGLGGSQNVLFVGLGAPNLLTHEKIRKLAATSASLLRGERCFDASLDLASCLNSDLVKLHPSAVAQAFGEGFGLFHYGFDRYKTEFGAKPGAQVPYPKAPHLTIIGGTEAAMDASVLKSVVNDIKAVNESVRVTRDWSNEPSNTGFPEFYAQQAKKQAAECGLKVKILTEKELRKEKMGLFLGVGEGSNHENRLVVLEYVPEGAKKNAKTIALVGKGVTFDSGGISIKPSMKMEDMKHDMTGAATVMGAILLAARRKVPNRVIAVMGFAENMPDASAIQPGNILTSRSGKTVEILNTDAEGRLVLADALDYAQDYKPDVVVDVATLTGAVSIALGKQCCAVLGNDQKVIDGLRQAGEDTGERMWQLPMYDEYLEDLKSDYADLKNSVNDRYAGTVRAAMFLKQFIRKDIRWAHLDIAGTGYQMGHIPYFPKYGASGAYVRALARFIADYRES